MKRGSLEDSGCSYDAEDETVPENPNQFDANESEDEHSSKNYSTGSDIDSDTDSEIGI